jgi:hypothetical protein
MTTSPAPFCRSLLTRAVVFAVALIGMLAAAAIVETGPALALEIRTFEVEPSLTQAGGHPDVRISYAGESRTDPNRPELICQCNDPQDLDISLPAGFIGNPHATPQCKAADFAREECAADSQVGLLEYTVELGGGVPLTFPREPVYNTIPKPEQAGLLSVTLTPGLLGFPLYTVLSSRTGSDYGLNANTDGLERPLPIQRIKQDLWGVPADPIHDPNRYASLKLFERGAPSSSPLTPFLQNPGVCNTDLSAKVLVRGYDGSVNSAESDWPQSTGCDLLTFNPSLSARPTTTDTDSASGVDINLTVPQLLSPTFPSPSEIKAATVTLPEGFSINPNAADGKTSCSDISAKFGSEDEAQCPEYAKVGTATIDSSALPAPLPGAIYIGEPQAGDRYRIFLTANGFATHIKLAGTVKPNPVTGQIVASFENLPQSPLTAFNMHFFGAERGFLATPTQCGSYPVKSTFVPWDNELPSQSATQFFELDAGPGGQPCPGPVRSFRPRFTASSAHNQAGAHSPFTIELGRDDGDQELSGLQVSTPPGFTAKLAGIPYCSEAALAAAADRSYSGIAEQASSSCPPASQVGTAVAGAGAGTHPVYLDGKVYLAGPYKGAPLSLAVVTPAVSGPYDLGNVVVRAAIKVDPVDAHVTAISDPLPRILDGIPLRLRFVKVSLDRDQFALNPTNCDPFSVGASILGDQGTTSTLKAPYQVATCAILPFGPKLSLKLTGGLRRRGHPSIHAVLTAAPGEANIKRVQVKLPKGELLDNAHIGTACTKGQFDSNSCPAGSKLGTASVSTPFLSAPLTGSIYLRASKHELPDLALDLEGQVNFETVARIDSAGGGLRATFETVPDVPVSKINVDLVGGSKGLLQNSESLCGQSRKATTSMTGQNGARLDTKTLLRVSCSGKARHKRHKRHQDSGRR